MSKQHQPNWIEAGRMLREAIEQYQYWKGYESLTRAIDDIADFMPGRRGEALSTKTVRRDVSGEPIPDRRVELYTRWLREKAKMPREWGAEWLEHTAHPRPGELLALVYDAEGDLQKLYTSVRKSENTPYLRGVLWGQFLGRKTEIEKAIRWADHPGQTMAALWGFGGNGKTTIQLKFAEDFVYGSRCPLRWPYAGVVWISARDYPRGLPSLLDILRKVGETFELLKDKKDLGSVSPSWLKQEVDKLLQKKRVLVLLDNFESISHQNQIEILEFFGWLTGPSKVLISSRHRVDLDDIAYILISVDGLLPDDAEILIHDYLKAKDLSPTGFDPDDLQRLAVVTRNNPKAILAALGIVGEGIPLPRILHSITTGAQDADRIFEKVIDTAWQDDLLDAFDRDVLMAVSFFSQPVSSSALGRVAGVNDDQVSRSIAKLQIISFFERPFANDSRVRTHPLAQDFAYRILRNYPDFERQAEARWWSEYATEVIRRARQTTYTDLQAKPELADDVVNVLERIEKHIRERSSYCAQAAEMFAGHRRGLGTALRQWGWWDEVLRLAEITLALVTEHRNARLIGRCALDLISTIHRERYELDKAEMYVGRAIEQNAVLGDRWLQAAINAERADILRRRGFFKAAKQESETALQTYLELGDATDIASTYLSLGGVTIEIATSELQEAVDSQWQTNEDLYEAEEYFREAERYLNQLEETDPARRFNITSIRAWRGVAARVQGNLEEAGKLFRGCMGQFQSLLSVARLYRELALVEHLAGRKDLAHQLEDQGLALQRQMGVIDILPPHNCYKVIEQVKKDGRW